MSVQIGCAECGKKYRVDEKFIGKKIRCKNCQAAIRVEAAEVAPPAPAVKAAAAGKAKPAAQAAPAPKRASAGGIKERSSAPQPEALDLPDLSGLDLPSGGPALELDEPEAAPARRDPGCPSCGAPFPAANRVCLECGFNRSSGQKARTQVDRSGMARAEKSEQRSGGVRVWQAYEHPVLNFLDVAIPKGALALFLGLGALSVVSPLIQNSVALKPMPGGMVAGMMLLQLIGVVMMYVVVLRVTVMGVGVAGRMLKFEVPEDGRSRVLGTHLVATVMAVIVLLICVFLGGAAAVDGKAAGAAGVVLAGILLSVGTYLVVGCLCFQLLFHLKIAEALLGYLLMLVFFVLGLIANFVILLAIGLVLGLVLGLARSV